MEPHVTQALIERRAEALGIELPGPPSPKGSYRPSMIHDGVIYTSGVGPMLNGTRLHCGYVGGDVTVEQAQEAAVVAAVNALTAACAGAGGVDSIDRLLKLTAFVRSAPGFTQQSAVVDRASGVLHELLGERGAHARSAGRTRAARWGWRSCRSASASRSSSSPDCAHRVVADARRQR